MDLKYESIIRVLVVDGIEVHPNCVKSRFQSSLYSSRANFDSFKETYITSLRRRSNRKTSACADLSMYFLHLILATTSCLSLLCFSVSSVALLPFGTNERLDQRIQKTDDACVTGNSGENVHILRGEIQPVEGLP